jgi:hypothetical protein
VCVGDRLHDRKTQPRALLRGRRRGPEEALEEPVDLVGGNSHARVRDLDHRRVVATIDRERHRSFFRRELDRVREQVPDELTEPHRVGPERERLVCRHEAELDVLHVGCGACRLDLPGRQRDEVDMRRFERQAPGVDPGDGEDVVDEPEQPLGVPAHDLEEARLLLGQLPGLAVEHQLEVADDRGDRRSQLVRDRADELVLHPVELEQLLVLFRERLRDLSLALQQVLALERERELGGNGVEEMTAARQLRRVDVGDELGDELSAYRDRRAEGVAVSTLARRDDVRLATIGQGARGAFGVLVERLAAGRAEQLARVPPDHRLPFGVAPRTGSQIGEAQHHQHAQ